MDGVFGGIMRVLSCNQEARHDFCAGNLSQWTTHAFRQGRLQDGQEVQVDIPEQKVTTELSRAIVHSVFL